MSNYRQLLEQRAELERAISAAKSIEMDQAIMQIKSIIAEFGLRPEDVFPPSTKNATRGPKAGSKATIKYRDAATGRTWTGRGKAPLWIADKDRTKYLVEETQ
jgi:DNA-binding protein H-NS